MLDIAKIIFQILRLEFLDNSTDINYICVVKRTKKWKIHKVCKT